MGTRIVDSESEDSATLGVDGDEELDGCVSWTVNDEGLPRSEMSWVSESGGFERIGGVILTGLMGLTVFLTVYTVFAVKD